MTLTFFPPVFWLLQEFAISLRDSISSIREMPKIRNLTFVLDACKMLEQARKVRPDNKVLLRFRFNSVGVFLAFQTCDTLGL